MKQIHHLISIDSLEPSSIRYLVERSVYFSQNPSIKKSLEDFVVGIYFKKTSTRTRTGFSSGALRLGARIVTFGPNDLQINTGETLLDTRQVLSKMLDCMVARTAESQDDFKLLSEQSDMAIINAMSYEEHPTQAITDLSMIQKHFGKIDGLKILYVGEGNNTASALALAATKFKNMTIEFRTPAGYGLDPYVSKSVEKNITTSGSCFCEKHNMINVNNDFDVVYTTRWKTTGTIKPEANWREKFIPFQVNEKLMAHCKDAIFMHDLPAHREEEVTGNILDGNRSIAFQQAAFKMYSAMAILEWSLLGQNK